MNTHHLTAKSKNYYRIDRLDHFDAYNYLLFCPIAFITSVSLFIMHAISKELRKQPGDLIMMIAFSDSLLVIHWLSSALGTNFMLGFDKSDDLLCTANSIIAVLGASLQTFYNFSFLVYLLLTARCLNQKPIKRKWFHILSIGISTLITCFSYFKGKMGRNDYGTCSTNRIGPGSLTIGILTWVIISISAYCVLTYIKRFLPQHTEELATLKRNFFNFYATYLEIMILIWMTILLALLMQYVGENENPYLRPKHVSDNLRVFGAQVRKQYSYKGLIFNLGKLGQIAKVLSPILFFVIRVRDPLVFKKIANFFKCRKRVAKERRESMKNKLMGEDNEELDIALQSRTNDLMWINHLSSRMKESLHRTFMACIAGYYPEVLDLTDDFYMKRKNDNEELRIIKVDGKELMQVYGCEEDESILNCTFTVYAPKLFLDVIGSFYSKVDFRKSLDIKENAVKIKKMAQDSEDGKGGKSGEFFFLTKDRKLILKTTNETEGKVFLDFLYDYSEHFKNHPTSQIGRIFGLFDIRFEDAQRSVKLFVMEALDPLHKEGNLRKYDLKGSEYDRMVLDHRILYDFRQEVKNILKDKDFDEIDGYFQIKKRSKKKLMSSLKKDVEFFKRHSVIDYSLIVSIVDKTKLPDGYLDYEKKRMNYRVFQSDEDPDIVYFFGIIDYFQLYTTMKKLERFFKMGMKCNFKLETSSQPPERYASRFLNKMAKNCYDTQKTRKSKKTLSNFSMGNQAEKTLNSMGKENFRDI